jgi:hypothetical protein
MRKGRAKIDFDSAWKFAVETFLQQCIELLFPALAPLIDWGHPPTFLNTELRKIRPESQTHKRFVDVLARVMFRDGQPRYLYLHIEIQAQPDPQFPLRMFVYHYRIFDSTRFGEVVSLAILADADPDWRPERFERSLGGCELAFRFPTAKLLDLDEQELQSSPNPFALVVLAHLRALKARGDVQLLFGEKVELIRAVARSGYNPDDVANLYRVVDYLMTLPKELEAQVEEIVREVAREQRLPKLTNLERFALERGARQGLQEGLEKGLQQGLQQGSKDCNKDCNKDCSKACNKDCNKDCNKA